MEVMGQLNCGTIAVTFVSSTFQRITGLSLAHKISTNLFKGENKPP